MQKATGKQIPKLFLKQVIPTDRSHGVCRMTRSAVEHGRLYTAVSATVLTLLTAVACGDSQPLPPVAPRIPVPTEVRNVAIKGVTIEPETNVLKLGQTQEFYLKLELSDSSPPVGPVPQWTSSNPSVVALARDRSATSSGGALDATATGIGVAIIEVIAYGHTATRQVQVVP